MTLKRFVVRWKDGKESTIFTSVETVDILHAFGIPIVSNRATQTAGLYSWPSVEPGELSTVEISHEQ